MGGLGLALAGVYALLVRDQAAPAPEERGRLDLSGLIGDLFPRGSVAATYVASGLQLFVPGALIVWLPSVLNRSYGLPQARAAVIAALIVLVGGVGMIAGGALADRFGRAPRRRLAAAAAYCLVTAALLSAAWTTSPGMLQLGLLAGGMMFASASLGPAGAAVADQTRPHVHSTVFATLTLANNLLGLALGPFVVGWLADRIGLTVALTFAVLPSLAAAGLFALGAHRARADRGAGAPAQDLAEAA
jgi:MFS family permease